MKESASIVLRHNDIEDILFEYYFGESHPSVKKQIEKTGKMLCNIESKDGFFATKRYIYFTIMYENKVESLGKVMTEQVTVSLTELWDIINEKIRDYGYEIEEIDENLTYGFDENAEPKLSYITFFLKKKNKDKIKSKGWKKNV